MSTESLAAVVGTLGLPDEDFFAIDGAATTALQARVAKIVRASRLPSSERGPLPELRAIGAPAQVDWRRHRSFPLLLAEVRGKRRVWEVDAAQNRWLLVSNLDTGSFDVIAIRRAHRGRPLPDPPSRSGTPPDEFNATLSSIGVRQYDLLRWFTREQLPGRLALTVLEYDLVSNTVLTHAQGEDGPPAEGAALRGSSRIAVHGAARTPSAPGLHMEVPATAPADAPTPLRAELRLARRRVTSIDAPPGATHPLLLAASLLLVQLDRSEPVLLHLAVPASPDAAGEIEAAFDLDLRAALAGRAAPGHWQAYLVVGDSVAGPQPLEIEQP